MLGTCFYVVAIAGIVAVVKTQVPGTCTLQKETCTSDKCVIQITVYSNERLDSVRWFRDESEINVHGRMGKSQYTGSLHESHFRCSGDTVCVRTVIDLIMKPFLPNDFGIYKGFLTTKNQTEIYCEAKFVLKLSNQLADSDQSGVVTVKTNYIYIGIGIVAGFGLLIVILILTVIHLARRNRKRHATATSTRTTNNKSSSRIPSIDPSHHTYESISSDVIRYESLAGRRGTREGYAIPMQQIIPEDGAAHLHSTTPDALTVPEELEDDISDFSITMDSAFSSSTLSLVIDDAMMSSKYSSENFRTNRPGIHFSNGEYHTNRDIDTDSSKTDTQRTDGPSEYQNMKNQRRLS